MYKVHPLPEAMFSFVWDYGSLPKQEEREYIQKILKNYSTLSSRSLMSDTEIVNVTNAISDAHSFTKDNEAEWAVSLRDVNRFILLLDFFLINNTKSLQPPLKRRATTASGEVEVVDS